MLREVNSKKNNNVKNNNLCVKLGTDYEYKHEIIWEFLLFILFMHICSAFGLYKVMAGDVKRSTILWTLFLHAFAGESVIAAHRCFAHRSYKASPLLQAVFIVFFTIAGQLSLYTWVRIHRLHHRYSDTDGDPHNSNRGFFFSHIGWLLVRKHPLVLEFGKTIEMRDLEANPWIMWQHKYYRVVFILVGVCFPAAVAVYLGDSWTNSILVSVFFRHILSLHTASLVNSLAHSHGTRPYEKNVCATENWFVSLITMGEGWHNYHHTFPWDYRASEYGMRFNLNTYLIEFYEKLGLAWDLKTASADIMEKRILRTGDGTHHMFGNDGDKSAVTTPIGVDWPNSTYTDIKSPPQDILYPENIPLFHENDIF